MSEMKRDYILFLEDILTSIEKIEAYTNDLTFKEFSGNSMALDAVIRNFEIIGEATKNIPEKIKNKHLNVEWKEAMGLRDILIHDYFGIDIESVWDTIKNNIPNFKKNIQKVFKLEKSVEK